MLVFLEIVVTSLTVALSTFSLMLLSAGYNLETKKVLLFPMSFMLINVRVQPCSSSEKMKKKRVCIIIELTNMFLLDWRIVIWVHSRSGGVTSVFGEYSKIISDSQG